MFAVTWEVYGESMIELLRYHISGGNNTVIKVYRVWTEGISVQIVQ